MGPKLPVELWLGRRTSTFAAAEALVGGVECAWQQDGWSLGAEWQLAELDAATDQRFSGGHVEAAWRPGGEARGYSRGKAAFTGFAPADPRGAIEWAARLGHTELDAAGTQNDWSLGFNFQWSERSRWMLHLQQSRSAGAELRGVLLRVQLGF